MSTIVIYKSKYGSTKYYADMIASGLNCRSVDAKEFKPSDFADYDTVIYGGGLYAEVIAGLSLITKNSDKLTGKKVIVFTTGLTPLDCRDYYDKMVIEKNFKGGVPENIRIFNFLGKMILSELSLPHRAAIKTLKKIMSSKENPSDMERLLIELCDADGDFTDKNSITELVEYAKKSDTAIVKAGADSLVSLDKIRGTLFGGGVGDALGYAVEFISDEQIFSIYGERGITEYALEANSKKAPVSDDTQMTLFTANGLLCSLVKENGKNAAGYVASSYSDWLLTQATEPSDSIEYQGVISYLLTVKELFAPRAPGNTCISGIAIRESFPVADGNYIKNRINNSKGCGGVMRVAPVAFFKDEIDIKELDILGAQIAAITHSHPLGYLPAAVLVHIVREAAFSSNRSLTDIVKEALDTVLSIFGKSEYSEQLRKLVNLAIELAQTSEADDLENIRALGEGWVAEETLAIAVYCAIRYHNDFSNGIIAAVNHNGDSDSTGAVTGNILGAYLGYDAIEDKWKEKLELSDTILQLADDLYFCLTHKDGDWKNKYMEVFSC